MAREQKIKGYDFTGVAILGGIGLIAGIGAAMGRSGFLEQRFSPMIVILGAIVLLVAIIPSLGKRYGSRGAMIGGGIGLIALGGLATWGRIDNLGYLDRQGMDPALGYWLALGGGILTLVAGLGHTIVGIVGKTGETVAPAIGRVEAGVVPPPPPPEPAWQPTHRVPPEGMPATPRPDPKAEILATLEAGLELRLLEQRDDWARVRTRDGWECWVDGRKLLSIEPAAV